MKPLGSADPKSVGPFQLLGVLGAGGMGRVYLGTSRTGRRVAIKVIRPDLAEDSVFRDRFTREVAAARRVSPLFTAAVVDADTMAEAPWLATTYIEGVSLDRRVLDDGPMDADEVLSLAAGLGEALTSIHSVGLVHRDLKPSNILLNDSGPHIIDFGLALGSEQSRLTTSLVVGTPSYMAPERLRGEEAGTPSDIFSLGATLVFAATGRDLVDDANVYEQVLQIAEARFDLSDVPARMRAIVVRCVSYAPHDRPTAAELTRFVVALGAAAPGGGVDDVTVKIATKRRAEARAAGVPVRTTPRRPGDPDTPEIVVPAVPAAVVAARAGDAEVTADAGQGSGEGASKDRTTGGSAGAGTPVASTSTPVRAAGVSTPTPPGDPSIPAQPTGHTGDTPARPGSGGGSTPGRSAGIPSAAFSPWPNAPSTNDASTDSDADTPHHVAAFAPAADFDPRGVMKPNGALRNGTSGSGTSGNGTSANGAASNGTSANGASGNGDSHASAPRVAVGTVVGDGGWSTPPPPDSNLGPGVELMPPRSTWSRRKLMATGGAALAVAATGGVLAAVELAARQQPGSVGPSGALPSSSVGHNATSGTTPTAPPAETGGGAVLWTAKSGAGNAASPGNLPGGQQVIVTPSGVIVSLRDQNRRVAVSDQHGNVVWASPVSSSDSALWLWGDGVLVADGQWLTYLALKNGFQRFKVRPADLAQQAIGPNHGLIRITRIVLTSTTAYLGLGSATLAMNKSGNWVRTIRIGGRSFNTPETPTAANADYIVTQVADELVAATLLYRPNSRYPIWQSAPYPPLSYGVDAVAPGGLTPAPPGDDPEINIAESVITDGVVVARIGRDLQAYQLTGDGSSLWHNAEKSPVHAIAPLNSSVLVASSLLSRYDAFGGTVQWAVQVPAIRLAVATQPAVIVAATMGGVTGVDTHGRIAWNASLPGSFIGAEPTSVTINPALRVAYVTFRPKAANVPDVTAIALDKTARP